ncbi:MAG: hypothetical protein J2P13_08125 [Acidobacteria bacterium]|nr:hypothetical protein [Acidobacteriota bacterium]
MRSLKAVLPIVLCLAGGAFAQGNHQLSQGTEIKVRTDTVIPAKPAADQQYTATVSNDVTNSAGQVAIPRGSRAVLVAVPTADGKDTHLDLRYVTVSGQKYELTARSTSTNAKQGLGVNKRTGMYVGGGAAIGGILGALLGGGKGAGIGAILGGAGGAGAQVYGNKKKEIPAETELSYKLAEDIQMQTVRQ